MFFSFSSAISPRLLCFILGLASAGIGCAHTERSAVVPSLALPTPGQHALHVLSPVMLELAWITNGSERDGLGFFQAMQSGQKDALPEISVAGKIVAVRAIGFKRRAVFAPLRHRDLRVGNFLYLQLSEAVSENQEIIIRFPGAQLGSPLVAKADALRFSPAIHVNQEGYFPGWQKTAMVGFYLGSLGELDVSTAEGFHLIDARTNEVVYHGNLVPRPDEGFPLPWYQRVLAADFSNFKIPGEYRLVVPGLGASYRFNIDDGVPASFARAYALGLYHQRCGTDNSLPFTRFVHAACHTAPAEVPTIASAITQELIASANQGYNNPLQTAPALTGVESSLYPFVQKGKIDVAGGHHDAGDYSKYTINSAGLVHHLVFAVDSLPGAGELDNLGMPESGDGKSDLLQTAKWEADFLAKLQDADGGFYFLVYPRDRRYENDVLPDQGDPQVVWPKNTAITAGAVAALAQCASSPRFKREFPEDAARYLESARRGWAFLKAAIEQHGKDGAYQKLTHYGDEFTHNDELAWAACELFAATGEQQFHDDVHAWLQPADPETRRWGWVRLSESYGRAIRAYAFAARSGRLAREQLDPVLLGSCENELIAAANDSLKASRQSAYGVSFHEATKRTLGAGWFFPLDLAFDLAVACQLEYPREADPRADYFNALLGNLNYEQGTNPINQSYLTGMGWQRQREIVHHYALNDRRSLPPTGIPIGSIQGGFAWLDFYKQELGALCFPLDGDQSTPYPIYDRWGDSFNLATEFVVVNQARGLAVTAWLMAETPLRRQPWRASAATVVGLTPKAPLGKPVTARLSVPDLDLNGARIVWEARDQEPVFGPEFTYTPGVAGDHWVEAEAQWPDGRRVFASVNFTVFRP